MAKVLITEDYLTDIGDAIRSKLEVETTYKPSEMANAIESIEGYPEPTGTKSITANGTGIDVKDYAEADVNVPNSYSQSDEGKVVNNGALVSQTSQSVTQNGTYDTTLKNEVVVNVSGGGGSGAELDIDFTSLGTKTLNGVEFSSAGATFNSALDYIDLDVATLISCSGVTIELDIASMSLTSGGHRRFLMGSADSGFIYRNNGKWALYNGLWEEATFDGASDGSFFDDCTIKLYIDSSNHWHIYKDGVLIFEPSGAQPFNPFRIGSSGGQSINNAVITALRMYKGQH